MQERQYSIRISAPKERVWLTLWTDETQRDWGNIIDEGMYIKGELAEGNVVEFLSDAGLGVSSRVEKHIPNHLIVFRHLADTADNGRRERENEWTGGAESYALSESSRDSTVLTITLDVPDELVELFDIRMPQVLERVKIMSESA